jgi:hypothetical protein
MHITLFVTTGRIEKSEIMKCFDLKKVEFFNNSDEDEYKQKHYVFEGDLEDLVDAAMKLDELSDYKINYALMLVGARSLLLRTNGSYLSRPHSRNNLNSKLKTQLK